jgi:hypothetical protein
VSQQINLYNPALIPKPDPLSGRVILLALCSLCLSLTIAYAVSGWLAARAASREALSAATLAQIQSEITRLSQELSIRKPNAELTAELASLDRVLAQRNDVIAVLKSGVIGDTKGASEYFRAFARQTVDGLWLTGFTVAGAGKDISIEGRTLQAELVPLYIQRLGREEALRGHAFATLSVQPPTELSVSSTEPRKTAEFLEFRMSSRAVDAPPARGPAQ